VLAVNKQSVHPRACLPGDVFILRIKLNGSLGSVARVRPRLQGKTLSPAREQVKPACCGTQDIIGIGGLGLERAVSTRGSNSIIMFVHFRKTAPLQELAQRPWIDSTGARFSTPWT